MHAVSLFYFDRQSCANIAADLKTSEEAVRQRLRRARLILSECIGGQLQTEPADLSGAP